MMPGWAWKLLFRHYKSQGARPAIRWMNRLAVLGLAVGSASWMSVSSIMDGLQNERRALTLSEKAHLVWEGTPRPQDSFHAKDFKKKFGAQLKRTQFLFQTEGLLEIPSAAGQGKTLGSGVVLQGVSDLGERLLLGAELAYSLGVGPGDEVRLRSAWKVEIEPLDRAVSGVFESGLYDVDRLFVRVDRDQLEKWLGFEHVVSRVEISLKDPYRAAGLRGDFEKSLGVPLKTWQENEASLWYSLKLEKIFMNLAMFFVVLLAALAVHLALSVRVADKTREIAVLMAMGAQPRDLTLLYLVEGAVLGVVGASLGLLMSWGLCSTLSGYFEMPDFYYSQNIPVDWSWARSTAMFFITVLVATLASWLPAKRVTHTEIQEALRS